jgi:hypothetical protein
MRSGSTPVYQLILHYLKSRDYVVGLGEYFSPFFLGGDPDIRLLCDRIRTFETRSGPIDSKAERIRNAAARFRLSLIEKAPQKYFFKVLSANISEGNLLSLSQGYDWICLERRDLYSQLLSYLISLKQNIWYQKGGIQWGPGAFRASREEFVDFERQIWCYVSAKAFVRPLRVVLYEDFCELGAQSFLKTIGMSDFTGSLSGVLSEIQNKKDKTAAFSNRIEIESWYRSSFLQDISPMSRRSRRTGHLD